jgi:hypothetical protein
VSAAIPLAMAFSILALAVIVVLIMVLKPELLQDKPRPDESGQSRTDPDGGA